MARNETPQMTLISVLLQQKVGKDLRTYLTDRFGEPITLRDGTVVKATYDDLARWIWFDTRDVDSEGRTVREGERVVRESVRNWVHRYGIPEPEHDYGVKAEDMPDGTEPVPAEV